MSKGAPGRPHGPTQRDLCELHCGPRTPGGFSTSWFHTGIGVRLRHMGIKVPLRRTRIGVGLRHTGIRVRLFHMVGMVRFCGAVFPYGFEGAPVRILGMVPGPGLSCGLSYAVGIRKPFQVINILPPSPGDNWDGFRRGAANTAPWDASGLVPIVLGHGCFMREKAGKGGCFFPSP